MHCWTSSKNLFFQHCCVEFKRSNTFAVRCLQTDLFFQYKLRIKGRVTSKGKAL